jgi:hypothetical protein
MTYTEIVVYVLAVAAVWGGTVLWLLWENIHHERKRRQDG